MTVRIVTDSTADLPPDLLKELDITVVPACVILGNKTYRDGIDISQEEVYHKMIDENIPASTSQPPPMDFANAYRKLLKDTDEIVSIQATSKLSGLYNSALLGREMTKENNRIEVVDSLSVSMGLGLLAILAAQLAKAGENLPTIVEKVKQSIPQIRLWGFFDTLKYALKGGRLGKAKALLGSVLPIKAILTMRDGELHPTGAVRTRIRGIERLVDNFRKSVYVQNAAVVYSTTPNDARTLRDRISTVSDKIPIHISRLGPALGVHGGPGTLILALREKVVNLDQEIEESEQPKKRISIPYIQHPKLDFIHL
ncbi:MAG: DegV family protein [Dehalococcoidia bacterium]|nr:MAG: DegV family protein [Dehalococcoidia bacterium]